MKTEIEIFVHGTPKGQPRPRAFSRGGMTRVYDPGTAEGWKSAIAEEIREHLPEKPLEHPVWLSLVFVMPRPKLHYGSGKNAGKLKPDAPYYFTPKPDADNLAKAVMDALTQVGLWRDDSLVCKLTVVKRYESVDGASGCFIQIGEITQ